MRVRTNSRLGNYALVGGGFDVDQMEIDLLAELCEGFDADLFGLDVVRNDTVCICCAEVGGDHLRGCPAAESFAARLAPDKPFFDWSTKKAKPAPIWDRGAWKKRTAKYRSKP